MLKTGDVHVSSKLNIDSLHLPASKRSPTINALLRVYCSAMLYVRKPRQAWKISRRTVPLSFSWSCVNFPRRPAGEIGIIKFATIACPPA